MKKLRLMGDRGKHVRNRIWVEKTRSKVSAQADIHWNEMWIGLRPVEAPESLLDYTALPIMTELFRRLDAPENEGASALIN